MTLSRESIAAQVFVASAAQVKVDVQPTIAKQKVANIARGSFIIADIFMDEADKQEKQRLLDKHNLKLK